MVKAVNYLVYKYKIHDKSNKKSSDVSNINRATSFEVHSFNFDTYRYCFGNDSLRQMSLRGRLLLRLNRMISISQYGESFKILLIGEHGTIKAKVQISSDILRRLNDSLGPDYHNVLVNLNI